MRTSRPLPACLAALALAACIPEEAPPSAPTVPASPAKAPDAGALEARDAKGLMAAVESLKGELKDKPRDFAIDMALGNLFFDNGRYVEALEYYRDAERLVAGAERALVAVAGRPAAKQVPAACRAEDAAAKDGRRPVEAVMAAASDFPEASPEAVACLRELGPALAHLRSRQGNAWYLAGNGDKARELHEAALLLDADLPESLFFRGAHILEAAKGDPAALARGRAEWERLLRVAPDHPRAAIVRETLPRVEELFGAKGREKGPDEPAPVPAPAADAQGPAPLAPGLAEAMQAVERTPELERQLDQRLADGQRLLDEGKWQEALDAFKAVMPLRPDGRVALGLGIALRELGKPTAERVLAQAVRMPGGDPRRASYELALFYEKSNPAQARPLYESLAGDAAWGAKARARLAAMK
jgi:tetratricopeptide (TPR) repeat protein